MKNIETNKMAKAVHTHNLKNRKGITLIALIVTIIVLLILAGVAIVTLTGENGILSKAQLAKERVAEKEAEENERLSQYENEIDSVRDGATNDEIKQYIKDEIKKQIGLGVTKTTIWSGTANEVKEYEFDIENVNIKNDFNFVLINYSYVGRTTFTKTLLIDVNDINLNIRSDFGLEGFSERYIGFHFTNNGFYIDEINPNDNSTNKFAIRKIMGIR